jgi:hypothetical protein
MDPEAGRTAGAVCPSAKLGVHTESTSVQIFDYNLLQRGELYAHLQIHVVRNELMQM